MEIITIILTGNLTYSVHFLQVYFALPVHFPHTTFLQDMQQLLLLFLLQYPTWQLFRSCNIIDDEEAPDRWQMFSLFSASNSSAKLNMYCFLDIVAPVHYLYSIHAFIAAKSNILKKI